MKVYNNVEYWANRDEPNSKDVGRWNTRTGLQ